jgi:murein DD-endopeptidase MepM/ murein hydrolase activator NlpD
VDIRRRSHYLLAILEHDRKRIDSYVRTVEKRRAALDQVDSDRATVASLQAELRIKEASLRDERARKLTLLQQVRERKDLASRVLVQRDQAVASLQRATLDPVGSAASPSTNASFRASHGSLPWPTTGRVVSGFGWVDDPVTGQRMFSNGLDIAAAYGTPFRAVFPGVVKRAGFISSFGQTVVLDHGAYTTVYAHANGLKVSTGQSVEAGDVLGFVGNSGLTSTTDYVLYFEVRYNGTAQDPMSWLGPQR